MQRRLEDPNSNQPGQGPKSLLHFVVLLLCGAAIGFALLNWNSSETVRKASPFDLSFDLNGS
jgi:hypothetical protein